MVGDGRLTSYLKPGRYRSRSPLTVRVHAAVKGVRPTLALRSHGAWKSRKKVEHGLWKRSNLDVLQQRAFGFPLAPLRMRTNDLEKVLALASASF